jgi:protein-serine/threonine kinase
MSQLVAGVEHLHEHGIAHRDLKLENCFLDSEVILKVADFGLSKAFAGENA